MQNQFRGWDLIPGILLTVVLLTACGQVQSQTGASTQGSQDSGPRIVLQPSSGRSNSPISIDGAGFPADMHITIGFGSTTETHEPVQVGEVVANSAGQFKLIFIIPKTWIDGSAITGDSLKITATSSDQTVAVSALYNVISEPGQPRITPESETVTPQIAVAIPQITIVPTTGAPGTNITVHGTGFPSQTEIALRIGLPGEGAMPRVYANTTVDGKGNASLSFKLPASWPDGRLITDKRLVIVVATSDGNSRAVAEFTVVAAASSTDPIVLVTAPSYPTQTATNPLTTTHAITKPNVPGSFSPEPISASVEFLNSLLRDPTGSNSVAFLSQRLRSEISANWALPTGLGIQPGYSSFQVALLIGGEESVVIQATLTYETGASMRNFTLIKEGANWRIDKVVSGSR